MANLRDWLDRWRGRLLCRERGQGLMEYGLIISVVSIAAVVLIMAMGPRVASMFSAAGASAFPSDRRRKGNFAAADKRAILAKLAAVPISTWTYRHEDPAIRHIGPMAQDFHRAFAVGDDEARIALVDGNGVALAAIQGLHEQAQSHADRLAQLDMRLAAVEEFTARERLDALPGRTE